MKMGGKVCVLGSNDFLFIKPFNCLSIIHIECECQAEDQQFSKFLVCRMKTVAVVVLFFVGCTVAIDTGCGGPPNGCSILNANRVYIDGKSDFPNSVILGFSFSQLSKFWKFAGIIIRQWSPLFKKLKTRVEQCGDGFVDIEDRILSDVDEALRTKNKRLLQFVFKIFAEICEKTLPYIRSPKLHSMYIQAVQTNRQYEQMLANGPLDMNKINQYFTQSCQGFDQYLNSPE